jgi:hypothetical protein
MKNVINKEILRSIVNETISNIIFESARDQMTFGTKGPIPTNLASTLCDDVSPDVLAMVDSGNRSIPKRMINDPKYFGGTKVLDAYTKYSEAMLRRADLGRTPLSFFYFLKMVRDGKWGAPLHVYESDGSYLIGTIRQGIFLCVYLCPKNAGIALFKLVKEVCEYNNVVFAVTDDMGAMLERLGCPKYDGDVMARSRGHDCEKVVYGSTKEAAEQGAKLVNFMGKSGSLKKAVDDGLSQNPKVKEFLDQNPDLVYDVMKNPIIMQCLMDNPQIIDFINNNPDIVQQIALDPIKGLLNGLIKYRNNMTAKSAVNERKNKK